MRCSSCACQLRCFLNLVLSKALVVLRLLPVHQFPDLSTALLFTHVQYQYCSNHPTAHLTKYLCWAFPKPILKSTYDLARQLASILRVANFWWRLREPSNTRFKWLARGSKLASALDILQSDCRPFTRSTVNPVQPGEKYVLILKHGLPRAKVPLSGLAWLASEPDSTVWERILHEIACSLRQIVQQNTPASRPRRRSHHTEIDLRQEHRYQPWVASAFPYDRSIAGLLYHTYA